LMAVTIVTLAASTLPSAAVIIYSYLHASGETPMLGKSSPHQRDYPALFGVVLIVLGTFVIGGITYTYTHRPANLLDVASHLIERHKPPAHP